MDILLRRAVCVICQIPWHSRVKLDVLRRGLAASCTNCSEQFVQDELQWSLEEEWRSSVQTVAEDHGDQVLGPVTQACDAWHDLPWRCQHVVCQWRKREVGKYAEGVAIMV